MSIRFTVILLWLVLIGLSASVYFQIGRPQINQYANMAHEKISGYGVISSEPTVTVAGNQVVVVKPIGLQSSLRVSFFQHGYFKEGDVVWFSGKVELPENFSSFDYVSYLEMKGVGAELKSPKILVVESNSSFWHDSLRKIKFWTIRQIKKSYEQNHANLILGMLIGYDESLSKDLQEAYRKVGLTHILVVSGFNLTILSGVMGVFAWLIGRRLADMSALGIVWVFVLLTGSSGTIVRAGIMASLLLLGRVFGLAQQSHLVLLWAVVIMSAFNPMRLFYDIGFQLSIAATYGVVSVNRLRVGKESRGLLAETLFPTIGAIIFTAPIIAYYFGTFSLVAPISNLAVLPFIPLIMLLGGLSLVSPTDLISPILSLLLNFQLWVVESLSNFSWSSIGLNVDLPEVISLYILLICFQYAYLDYKKAHLKKSHSSDKISKIII